MAKDFFLDATPPWREAPDVMRRFAIAALGSCLIISLGCAGDPEEPNAFMTQAFSASQTAAEDSGTSDSDSDSESNTTDAPPDMPASGDGDGDGDPDPTTGDGDPDPTTSGDGDPPAMCGNGIIDDGEQCDGGNLGGFTCVDLGYDGGTLACDMITCTFDASGCTNDGGTSGGTTG